MKKDELIEKMKSDYVNTLDGKQSLYELCYLIGVKTVVRYWNNVEKKLPKKQRTFKEAYRVMKVIHKYGLIFNNGFEISKVEKQIANLFKNSPFIEIRQRDE